MKSYEESSTMCGLLPYGPNQVVTSGVGVRNRLHGQSHRETIKILAKVVTIQIGVEENPTVIIIMPKNALSFGKSRAMAKTGTMYNVDTILTPSVSFKRYSF